MRQISTESQFILFTDDKPTDGGFFLLIKCPLLLAVPYRVSAVFYSRLLVQQATKKNVPQIAGRFFY
ncbi:MAG TPA: hypothetical protein VLR29_07140 [Flavobacterium sp.]|nr:hypothetical protein [Flavobacterium sp.]